MGQEKKESLMWYDSINVRKDKYGKIILPPYEKNKAIPYIPEYRDRYHFGATSSLDEKENINVSNISYLMQTNDFYYELLIRCNFFYYPTVKASIIKQMLINLSSVFQCLIMYYPEKIRQKYCNCDKQAGCPLEKRKECQNQISKKYTDKRSYRKRLEQLMEKDIIFFLEKSFYQQLIDLYEIRNKIHIEDEDSKNQFHDETDVFTLENYNFYKDLLDNTLMPVIKERTNLYQTCSWSEKKRGEDTCFKQKENNGQ